MATLYWSEQCRDSSDLADLREFLIAYQVWVLRFAAPFLPARTPLSAQLPASEVNVSRNPDAWKRVVVSHMPARGIECASRRPFPHRLSCEQRAYCGQ